MLSRLSGTQPTPFPAVPGDWSTRRALTLLPEATKNGTGTTNLRREHERSGTRAGGGLECRGAPSLRYGFALPCTPIKGLRRALSEDERRTMAKGIVEHLKLCGWEFRNAAS